MAVNVPGLVVMVFFYLMVLGIGIWASMKSKKVKDHSQADQIEVTLLGNRGISLVVGVFTSTGRCCRLVLLLLLLDLKSHVATIFIKMSSQRHQQHYSCSIMASSLHDNYII